MVFENEKKKTTSAYPSGASIMVGKLDDHNGNPTNKILDTSFIELAKEKCPAFRRSSDGSLRCPFQNVKNVKDLEKTISNVPKSHFVLEEDGRSVASTVPSEIDELENEGAISSSSGSSSGSSGVQYRIAIEHIYNVSMRLPSDRSLSLGSGECPFNAYNHSNNDAQAPKPDNAGSTSEGVTKVMERFSTSSIMAKLARRRRSSVDSADSTDSTESDLHSINHSIGDSSVLTHYHNVNLSTALKKGTQKSHKEAENVHFVRNFIKGKIDRDLYAEMINNLYFVYLHLEQLLEIHAPNVFPTLHRPHELHRTGVLEQDVSFFQGNADWKDTLRPSPATQEYVHRLHQIAATDPLLLLAHAYTRYLGDLSGGRTLQRVARKALKLGTSGDGLRFYDFTHVPDAKSFKNEYRRALDNMTHLTPRQVQSLVGEANVAFILNMRLFEELDVRAGVEGAQVRPLKEALAFFDMPPDDETNDAAAECPFLQKKKKQVPISARVTKSTLKKKEGRCPWPFVFFHDPAQGMRDYQTWVVLALVTCYTYRIILG